MYFKYICFKVCENIFYKDFSFLDDFSQQYVSKNSSGNASRRFTDYLGQLRTIFHFNKSENIITENIIIIELYK